MKSFLVDQDGYYGEFGGAYVPEILHKCVEELTNKYLEVIESEDFKEKERLVRQWNETIEVRGWMNQITSAELQQNKQQELLAACSADFLHALEGKNGIERKYDQRKQKLLWEWGFR